VENQVKRELLKAGHAADDIHGDRSQSQREAALDKFRKGSVNVLVRERASVSMRGQQPPCTDE